MTLLELELVVDSQASTVALPPVLIFAIRARSTARGGEVDFGVDEDDDIVIDAVRIGGATCESPEPARLNGKATIVPYSLSESMERQLSMGLSIVASGVSRPLNTGDVLPAPKRTLLAIEIATSEPYFCCFRIGVPCGEFADIIFARRRSSIRSRRLRHKQDATPSSSTARTTATNTVPLIATASGAPVNASVDAFP